MISDAEVEAATVAIQIGLNIAFTIALSAYVYFKQDWSKAVDEHDVENLDDNMKEEGNDPAGGTIIYRDGVQM